MPDLGISRLPPLAGRDRRAVLLMGPTGAGKTELALQLAQELPFEIISVDSALVYRGMDIGTAKPAAEVRLAVPHHLIDIRDPVMTYSAGEFVADAAALMPQIWARGRVPLLVGGTMLYFHALSAGIAALPEADLRVRAAIDQRAAVEGWAALHRELGQVDPDAAARIHLNDAQRIQRALEVYRLTGQPISRLQRLRESVLAGVEVVEVAVALEREVLNLRLAARFDAMLEAGFVAELERLRARSALTAEHPSMRAVGYRQMWRYLTGERTLQTAREEAIVATRQLAKRQLTWLRARPRARWFDATHRDVAKSVLNALSKGGNLP